MNDPILEALNFALDSELDLQVRVPSTSAAGPLYTRRPVVRNSKKILPSAVIFGEEVDTPCPIKGCPFVSPSLGKKENKDGFLAHLLSEHRFVIDDVNKIANLHKYIIYWKGKFEDKPLTEFCVGFAMEDVPVPSLQKKRSSDELPIDDVEVECPEQKMTEKPLYYMLTPDLQEDKDIRTKLWNQRLETVLEVNTQEREQKDFSRQCFFCREVFMGNRALLFEHMKKDHSFYIGNPDNVVFVEEFLELIGEKLNSLICLQCEKTFKDKIVLRDHMRKKGHKRLNSDTPEYNRYYIINYLEPGKDWKAFDAEGPDEEERKEEDWVETHEETPALVCLLCSDQFSSFSDVLDHMKTVHLFDFLKITKDMDFYQKVKVVNFVRRTIFLSLCLFCERKFLERSMLIIHLTEHGKQQDVFPSEKIWNQPEHFFPTYEDDQFLVQLDKDLENGKEDDDMSITSEENVHIIPEDLISPVSRNRSRELLEECRNNDMEFDYALDIKQNIG